MASLEEVRATAQDLMLRALELLDETGDHLSACHLQHALDVSRGVPNPRTIKEMEAQLDTPEARSLLARLAGTGTDAATLMRELTTDELRQRVDDELRLASLADDPSAKARHLNRASEYATVRERRMRASGQADQAS